MEPTNIPRNSPAALPTQSPSFDIFEEISRAWEGVSGTKASYWGAVGIIFIFILAFSLIQISLFGTGDEPNLGKSGIGLIESMVSLVLSAGLLVMAIRRARGEEIRASMVLEQFPKTLPLIVASIMMSILILIGFVLLIIPGLYLSISYLFAIPLIADKNLESWEALEVSRKLVTTRWFSYFGVLFISSLIVAVSALPFGIGLIWTLPMAYNLIGNLYTSAIDQEF